MTADHGLYSVDGDSIQLNFHAGQWRAWDSVKRFVCVLAGTQGGKTSFGPLWLFREITKRGPGDYIVAAPTFPLLEKKLIPEFLRYFAKYLRLGRYNRSTKTFTFSKSGNRRVFGDDSAEAETRVFFGHASNPDSLESATAKAAWLDECGQKQFKQASWEALLRRLSLAIGRALLTTTIYRMGWIKKLLYDVWERFGRNHPEIDIISFASTLNPAFPQEEYDRARRVLPAWKFRMFYQGLYTRSAGLIYTKFDKARHMIDRFPIPKHWKRYVGVDFGGVNTAAVFYAKNPDKKQVIAYRVYRGGNLTSAEHAKRIKANEPLLAGFGGARSEGQWRREFGAAGLPLRKPVVKEVDVGIDRVDAAHANDGVLVFSDLADYLDEKENYSYVVDEDGNVLDEIEDKNKFHVMDSERYIIPFLFPPEPRRGARSRQG